jgi:hypothetical protein
MREANLIGNIKGREKEYEKVIEKLKSLGYKPSATRTVYGNLIISDDLYVLKSELVVVFKSENVILDDEIRIRKIAQENNIKMIDSTFLLEKLDILLSYELKNNKFLEMIFLMFNKNEYLLSEFLISLYSAVFTNDTIGELEEEIRDNLFGRDFDRVFDLEAKLEYEKTNAYRIVMGMYNMLPKLSDNELLNTFKYLDDRDDEVCKVV